MGFLNRMEKKLGRFAIKNLMIYILALYVLGFVIQMVKPEFFYLYLSLDPSAILRGEVWRIVTFLIQPPTSSPLWMLLVLYMYYMIGMTLERAWGSFAFNLYVFTGILGHVIAVLVVYAFTHNPLIGMYVTTGYLNMSLFLAFAATFPDMRFLLFFVIPIKAKWLGLADAALFVFELVNAIIRQNWSAAIMIVMSFLNLILFMLLFRKGGAVRRAQAAKRRKEFQEKVVSAAQNAVGIPRHRCAVCGRTEKDDPNLTFRFCSKCEGNYEYCEDHLYTHAHVKK